MSSYHPLVGNAIEMIRRGELDHEHKKDIIFMRASFLKTDFFLGAFIQLPITSLKPHNEMHWKFLYVLFGKRRTEELMRKVFSDVSSKDRDYFGQYRVIEKYSEEMALEEFLRSPKAFTDFE